MEKHLKIKSDIQNVQKVESLIDDVTKNLKVDKTLYGNILISVFEAVNNAIIHGNKGDKEKNVNIDLKYDRRDRKLNISVEDEGNGFNYYNIPDPTAKENLENINGRGIFLMKQLSDEIIFHNNGSKVEVNFKI
jgi:serine/threonine-protein kinase RsbW